MDSRGIALTQQESRLLEQAREGDAGAFSSLVNETAPALERLALRIVGHRHDAEDVAQDAVLTAWRKLSGFRGEARFKTWITRILVNRALDVVRRRKTAVDVAAEALPSPDADPLVRASEREVDQAVRAAIETLPPVQRTTLLLRVDQGLAYEEIAYVLGSTRNAVRMNLVAARKRLAMRLRGIVDLGGDVS